MTARWLPLLLLTSASAFAADPAVIKPKPEFQYKSGDIRIPAARADEPKVKQFDASTIKAASRYLDEGSLCWVREKSCVNCHTTGPYMAERPALSPLLGKPLDEVREDFLDKISDKAPALSEKDGRKFYPGSIMTVWRAMGLAEWDKHLSSTTSEPTGRALKDMLNRVNDDGSLTSTGEVEIPHITTDFELSLQAARAITAAPGWLASLKDDALLAKVTKLKTFLRDVKPRNDYERVLRLQLASYLPELVSQQDRETALTLLTSKQKADGGWCLRDMSATDNWRTPMSDIVLKLIANLPDASNPQSDPYMTAMAIVLMRQAEVPASDPRIQRGLAWLKREQRISGRWWMDSLYRGNYNYITYIATAQAMKALALCGELKVE